MSYKKELKSIGFAKIASSTLSDSEIESISEYNTDNNTSVATDIWGELYVDYIDFLSSKSTMCSTMPIVTNLSEFFIVSDASITTYDEMISDEINRL